MLRVNKHRLDDELELQAEIQDVISEFTSLLNGRQQEAKDSLSRLEARMFVDRKAEKMSSELANAEISITPARVTAWQAYQIARREHEEWQGLLNAWVSRGYQLKVLADLFIAQYFVINTVHGPVDGARVDKILTTARAPALEARRQRDGEALPVVTRTEITVPRRRPLT